MVVVGSGQSVRSRIIGYVRENPKCDAKSALNALGLDYERYKQYFWRHKRLGSLPTYEPVPRGLKRRRHHQRYDLVGEGLAPATLEAILAVARKGEPGWTVSRNRNSAFVYQGLGCSLQLWQNGSMVFWSRDNESDDDAVRVKFF
jgi:hypothetical protein